MFKLTVCLGLSKGVPNFSRKPQPQRTEQQPDRIDELASALLDDSSLERVTPATLKTASGSALPSVSPPEHSKPRPALAAMVQDNVTAFTTNRMLASPPSRMAPKALRSKKPLHRSKSPVVPGKIDHGGSGSRPAKPTRGPMMASTELPDKVVSSVMTSGTLNTANIMAQSTSNKPEKLLDMEMASVCPGQAIRRSVAGTLSERPKQSNTVRRSKTMHPSRKTGLSNQKSVLKKMTDAITDRFHLTLKNADSGTNSDTRGEVKMEDILTGVIQVEETQIRKQSIRSRVVKHESPKKKAPPRPIVMGSRNCRSPRRSMSLIGDPFFVNECNTDPPNDFLIRLRASSTTEASCCTPNRSTTESLVSLMKGNLSSLGRGNPGATSSPRVQIISPLGRACDEAQGLEAAAVTSVSPVAFGGSVGSETPSQQSDEDQNEIGKAMESVDIEDVSPVRGYRYPTGGPVAAARASERKKHPSPSKDDLAILAYKFTVLRESKREEAHRQASPLSCNPEMQRHRTDSEVLNRYIVERLGNEEEDDLDELAGDCVLAALAKPTVDKRKAIAITGLTIPRLAPPTESRHRALSIQQGCYSPATAPDCACPGSDQVSLETDCPFHGGMAEVNELQWTDPSYNFVPRHVC